MKNWMQYCLDENDIINLDSASYHPISDSMQKYISELLKVIANPSSVHALGRNLNEMMEEARCDIADVLGCDSDEIYFTSGATESFATVMNIWEQLKKLNNTKERLMCSPFEHDTVKMYVDINTSHNLRDNDILMLANNETGEIYDHYFTKRYFYSDISSAIGNMEVNLHKLNVYSAGFSAEKFGGLSGAGCLYVSKDLQEKMAKINYIPLIAGHQEKSMRGGTENILGILVMGRAIKESAESLYYKNRIYKDFKNILLNAFDDEEIDYIVNENKGNNLLNILSVSFKGVDGQGLQQYLSNNNVFVGTGAACNGDSNEPSQVLEYLKVPKDYILGTIRFSFHEDNTYNEIRHVADLILDYFNNMKTVENKKIPLNDITDRMVI